VKPNFKKEEEDWTEAVKKENAAWNETVKIEVNNFQMSRSHINSAADLSIVKGNPIVRENKLYGRIQLEMGF
jgi:hypothetical protein